MGRNLLREQAVMGRFRFAAAPALLFFLLSFTLSAEAPVAALSGETVSEQSETTEITQPEEILTAEPQTDSEKQSMNETQPDSAEQAADQSQSEAGETVADKTDTEETSEADSEENPEETSLYPLIEKYKDRPEVEAWRQYYLSNDKRTKLIHDILENAMEYRLYVRKTVQDRGVPGELEYLPVVESGYKTSAKSRSGALGMWQFMENSVKPFLTLNEYVDERLDPWKSTEGGISKLQDNYRTFNDWLLAIGSYNCGVGAMNKAIRRGESRDFWELCEKGVVSAQTKDYVPKLIAIADLAVNFEEYEIDIPDHAEEFEVLTTERDGLFDYVTVKKPYAISAIARDMRMDERQLKKLNPALTKGFTPPATKYSIRVPVGMKSTLEDVISNLEPIEFPFQYKVEAGDSLWSISRKFGTTVQAICDTNGIEEKAILKIGKILYIPSK